MHAVCCLRFLPREFVDVIGSLMANGSIYSLQEKQWGNLLDKELVAHIPARILQCRYVAREVCFASTELIEDLSVVQEVYLSDSIIERWTFHFGFVIPNSENTWQSIIESAGDSAMLPPELLSGYVVIKSIFCNGEEEVFSSCVRVYYD